MFSSFMIAADKSGSGKTTLTTGLARLFRSMGLSVAPFKCGPDYIDTLHLEKASGRKAYNLDTVMLTENRVKDVYAMGCAGADVALTEGVMGFFDGVDAKDFSGSSAHVAAVAGIPVLLVIDCSGSSFTPAAVIKGMESLSKAEILGVVLNNVASSRHEMLVRQAVEQHTDARVLGVLPKNGDEMLRSRHLGIKTALETDDTYFDACAGFVGENVDTANLFDLSRAERPVFQPQKADKNCKTVCVAYDESFQFYYNSNISYLINKGFDVKYFSPLRGEMPNDCDMMYIGGGYPEVFAKELADNWSVAAYIREYVRNGGYVYAECGGLMYLTKKIETNDNTYNMCGVIDAKSAMCKRRQALGYVKAELNRDGIMGQRGRANIGHEFHYSKIEDYNGSFVYDITRITDGKKSQDGIVVNNAFAAYTHLNFMSENTLIDNLLEKVKNI